MRLGLGGRRRVAWMGAILGALGVLGGAGAVGASGQTAGPAAPSCPVHPPSTVRSARIGAASQLVPGAPTHLLLCRYRGLSGAPQSPGAPRLEAERRLGDERRVRALAGEMDRLPSATGRYSCPLDTGAAVYAVFGYSSLPGDPVLVDLTGCRTASNGHVASFASSSLEDQLKALVPAR